MAGKVLVFDLWADYAHMKKYYTTTSPLTFSVPPKTVIYGILGAILGLDKNEYLNYFQGGCQVGIRILKPIKKTRVGLNLIDTKKAKAHQWNRIIQRTQIRTEFLKDPAYRIYVTHQNQELYQKLKDYLQKHISTYTISLGLSENLANYSFIDEYEFEEVTDNSEMVEIATTFRIDQEITQGDIDFTISGREYFTDTLALEMKPDREVIEYGQVIFERNGLTIKTKTKHYYRLPTGENIIFI